MFDWVQVKWSGFIPKWPKQSHSQLVHWWVLVHSGHEKAFNCTYFMAGVLVPSASVKFLCDCTKCVICNGVKKMLKVLSQKYFKATTVHLFSLLSYQHTEYCCCFVEKFLSSRAPCCQGLGCKSSAVLGWESFCFDVSSFRVSHVHPFLMVQWWLFLHSELRFFFLRFYTNIHKRSQPNFTTDQRVN